MKILMIEDDISLCSSLTYLFSQKRIHTTCIHTGDQGLKEAYNPYDILIIDCMLPGISGIDIISQLRADGITTPIIILSALSDLDTKVLGFHSGSDDYIVKPFEFEELYARICRLYQRTKQPMPQQIAYGDLLYKPLQFELSTLEHTCILSKTEATLFDALIENKDILSSREYLINRVWGEYAYMEDSNLDNYIYFLRKKLKTLCSQVQIKNVHGIGYHLYFPTQGKEN